MATLAAKAGVRFNVGHLRPHIRRMLDVALLTAPPTYDDRVVVTSANDGKHMDGSLHYEDAAFDLRCWNIVGDGGPGVRWTERLVTKLRAQAWARAQQNEDGPDYQIRYEEKDHTLKDGSTVRVPHIHGEYDPVLERSG